MDYYSFSDIYSVMRAVYALDQTPELLHLHTFRRAGDKEIFIITK